MYAMIGTRPDIAFVLRELSKFVSKPGKNHLLAAKRVLRYSNFQKIIIHFSRGKVRKSYPCIVIEILHGAVRKMALELQVLFSKF